MFTSEEQVVVLYAQQLQPTWFVSFILGQFAWSKQREVLESVRDNKRTAVRSGHGLGKTRLAAYVMLWFLESFPSSRVITTAPTWNQVENLLWREIRSVWEVSAVPLRGKKLTTRIEVASDWFAIGLSTDEPERFSGEHAENILLIVDEASGVSDLIFEAGEGYMTTPGGRLLMIGNPTQNSGQFFKAFHSERALWNTIHMDVFQSPNFTDEAVPDEVKQRLTSREWVEDKKKKWGEGTPIYQVRVEGNFATNSENTVFSLGDIEYAQSDRVTYEPSLLDDAVVACDVARFGSDETVISVRQGRKVRIVETYVGKGTEGTFSEKSTVQTANRIIFHAKKVKSEHFPTIVVDDDGVGGGVTDQIRNQGYKVTAFRGGASAVESDEYPNARSELWFSVSDQLRDIDLDDDEQLAADLSAPEYKLDSQGRRVVEKKEEVKKRIKRSPDRADGVLLTFAPDRAGSMETGSYVQDEEELVYRKGDLVLHGEQYIDKPYGEGSEDYE